MIYRFARVNEDWLALRQKYLTATDFASLFALNQYMNVNEMIQSKVKRDKLENKFIRDGKILESAVIQAIKEDLGWDVGELAQGASLVFTDEAHRISSTPDAFRWDEPAVVECKSVNEITFNRHWRNGTPPMRYVIQVHVQMLTTGMYTGYLAGITPKPNIPLVVYKITRSKELDNIIIETADLFWEHWQTDPKVITKKANHNGKNQLELLRSTIELVGIYEYPEDKPAELDLNTIFGD